MKNFFEHLRSRVLAGFIFLIPLFAVVIVIQKLWKSLEGVGSYLVHLFDLKPVLGTNAIPIATALLLVVAFYFFGWLVKFSALSKLRDWIERTVLQYIPGYLTYKAQLQGKIKRRNEDSRTPVWVTTSLGKRPGLLIDQQAEQAIVFFPNSPDSNNGEVLLVAKQQVTNLDMDASSFVKSLQKFGKGLFVT